MNEYYIYMYLDQDNIPFYIGKGKDQRYLVSHHLSKEYVNSLLKNKIRKVGKDNIKIHFLHKDLTEEESFYWERYWIKYIGRRDKKEGTLCNLTDGGEGISGNTRSEELRKRLSKNVKDAWRIRGGHSEESIKKMILSRTGSKRSEETKQRMSLAAIKRFQLSGGHSEESKRKISEANRGKPSSFKGRTHSEESKRKNSLKHKGIPSVFKGKQHSEETKQLMHKKHKSIGPQSEEHKQKIREALLHRQFSTETLQKMRIAQRQRRIRENKYYYFIKGV